jgi:hypothetical protein
MSISEIQKRKFLENLYRSFYSTGLHESDTALRQPNDDEIKKEFDNYFNLNEIVRIWLANKYFRVNKALYYCNKGFVYSSL